MADKTQSKEQRYEKLVKAVAGGELAMVKYLWEMIERFEAIVDETPQNKVARMQREVEGFLKQLKDNPPKNGQDGKRGRPGSQGPAGPKPTKKELLELIMPLIPEAPDPIKPTKDELLDLIVPLIKPGKPGTMPDHEWDGTKIRFELPDGSWGEWTDLRGKQGPAGQAYGPSEMGSGLGGGLHRIRGDGFVREGVTEIYFGDNLTITRTGNGIRVDAEAGGGGGSGLDFETPTGTVDDSNVDFTVTEVPLYLVVNGAQYFENVHYTRSSLAITLNNPVGTGGFIRSAFGTGISVETPTGTIDDSNVTFTVSNEPKYIVINGAQYFDGAGYSYSAGTITLDNPVGTGGFIRSIY